jgi:hypothetical protein
MSKVIHTKSGQFLYEFLQVFVRISVDFRTGIFWYGIGPIIVPTLARAWQRGNKRIEGVLLTEGRFCELETASAIVVRRVHLLHFGLCGCTQRVISPVK